MSEFREATPGETLAMIKTMQKVEKEKVETETLKLRVNRINTFLIMRSFGSEVESDEVLYPLPGDTYKAPEKVKLTGPVMDEIFEKFVI